VDRREVRAFIDTNALLIGAVNLALEKEETAEVQVVRRLLKGEVKLVTSLKQLEELTVASRRVLGRDFAGWIRYLILTQINPLIIRKPEYSKTEKKYVNRIPDEDLTHFAVAVAGKAQYLVSENHEFLRKAAECKIIKCVTSTEFIKEIKSRRPKLKTSAGKVIRKMRDERETHISRFEQHREEIH